MGESSRQVMQDVIDRHQDEIARLTAEVAKAEDLIGRVINANDAITAQLNDAVARAETAEAQLAELRARVRPGVEEIAAMIAKSKREYNVLHGSKALPDYTSGERSPPLVYAASFIAQAIHAILPPVPKVLTVEEIWQLMNKPTKQEACEAIHRDIYGGEE